MQYYIHYECPKCEGDVYDLGLNLVEHNNLPVFDLDSFSQYMMTCDNEVIKDGDGKIISKEQYQKLDESAQEDCEFEECGYQFGTGDIEVLGEDEW